MWFTNIILPFDRIRTVRYTNGEHLTFIVGWYRTKTPTNIFTICTFNIECTTGLFTIFLNSYFVTYFSDLVAFILFIRTVKKGYVGI